MLDDLALPSDDADAALARPTACGFTFTGSGSEYFRIWIVNLMLSVATLGIYSAWAKVRRLQYFDLNTSVAGAVFDFHGDPKAILRGRVLAVTLLAVYHYAFGFSLAFGLIVVGCLLLALPYLMRSALRFRLRNTTYRGLPFDFSGSVLGAYAVYLPPLLTFLLPGVLAALDPTGMSTLKSFALYLAWPLMHGAMKRYQHRHIVYGNQASRYTVSAWRFYAPYAIATMVLVLGVVLIGLIAGVSAWLLQRHPSGSGIKFVGILSGMLAAYMMYLLIIPMMQVRLNNLVWSGTSFPGIAIVSRMKSAAFLRLQTVNVLFTLFSLGLYRPFAVVRVHRYRLAHMALELDDSAERIAAGAARGRQGAAGDGAADFLGVDLSW